MTVDDDVVAVDADVGVEAAVDAVVLQEMREHPGVGEVVDRDDFEVVQTLLGALGEDAEGDATDAAEPVDGNALGH